MASAERIVNRMRMAFCPSVVLHPIVQRSWSSRRERTVISLSAKPPRRARALAQDVQQALQSALQSRQSRLSVELPTGAQLGLEPRKQQESKNVAKTVGDREVARLMIALFEGKGLKMHVFFSGKAQVKEADRVWGQMNDVTLGEWRGIRGFGAGMAGGADVLVFVGDDTRLVRAASEVGQSLGMDKLVIMVNARAPEQMDERFIEVYHFDTTAKWKGGVVFRKHPHGKS